MADENLVTVESTAGRPGRRAQADINAEARARAARQAAKEAKPVEPEQIVSCRVLKKGDGKISTGQHFGGIGEVHYEKGETLKAPKGTAEELEERGFVEIEG